MNVYDVSGLFLNILDIFYTDFMVSTPKLITSVAPTQH